MKISKIKECRFCKSKQFKKVINLGHQHLQGFFQRKNIKQKDKISQKKFLTELVRCDQKKIKMLVVCFNYQFLFHPKYYMKNIFTDQVLILQ